MLVAWMRRLVPLLFLIPAAQVSARDDSLFTSSVSYCSEPDALLIQQFDVTYFQKNSSIWFNISAASVEPGVNVSANVMLNVYGMHPVNFTLDLCSLFNGALCPLPTYNFTGSDSIPLPSSLGVNDRIPTIAFRIPDLEAYAQLTLTDAATGQLKACIQATLSNGWSVHQVAVEWVTSAFGLLALLSAIWYSQSFDSLAPYRLFDLLYLFQWAASTALLDLNYSSVYIAFATNFSWALGLFPASATSPIQLSINNMRHLTGGKMADATSSSVVALVNRELSPYNAIATPPIGYQMTGLAETLLALGNTTPQPMLSVSPSGDLVAAGTVQLVTATSGNVLQAGVPIYVEYVGIATANAFMTIFLVALMLLVILIATLALGYGVLVFTGRRKTCADLLRREELYPAFAHAWLLRICIVALFPISIFAMYQWTLDDSWLSTLLSVVLFLCMVGFLGVSVFYVVRLASRATPYALYTRPKPATAYGPLFGLYRQERYFAGMLLLVGILVKAMFTAFAKANGEVQVTCILVIECTIFACLLFSRPHKTRSADILAIYLALTRCICTGLLIGFIQNLNVAAIPRVVIGIIIAVIISIAIVVMFVNTIVNLGLIKLPARFRRYRNTRSSDASILEKGEKEEDMPGRPRNPTPERNVPLDPNVNQPYPESPSEIATAEHTVSTYSEESGSTTLGSLLPRRWSLQPSATSHSRTPSQSQYSSTSASSPRNSHSPSPLYMESASHSKQPTIDEHESIT